MFNEHGNSLAPTPPVPNNRQLGEMIGAALNDHRSGEPIWYEVIAHYHDGVKLTYIFGQRPDLVPNDETVRLLSISYSSTPDVEAEFKQLDAELTAAMKKKLGEEFTLADCYSNQGGVFEDSTFIRQRRLCVYAYGVFDDVEFGATAEMAPGVGKATSERLLAIRDRFDKKYKFHQG